MRERERNEIGGNREKEKDCKMKVFNFHEQNQN